MFAYSFVRFFRTVGGAKSDAKYCVSTLIISFSYNAIIFFVGGLYFNLVNKVRD